LYPQVEVTADMAKKRPDLKPYVGQRLTVIAWIWARTVKSPNPAFAHVDVPLVSNFVLANKAGKEAYVEPIVVEGGYRFTVKTGLPADAKRAKEGTKFSRGNFRCIMSGNPIDPEHIKAEAQAGRMNSRLMAIVAEGDRCRIYLDPISEQQSIAREAKPSWKPDVEFFQKALGFRVGNYGMSRWSDLFTDRQILALSTFSDLVEEARAKVKSELANDDSLPDSMPLHERASGAMDYADAVATYLAFSISRSADFWSNLCTWANQPKNELVAHVFVRQALAMIWDFAEANPFSESGGNFLKNLSYVGKGIELLGSGMPGNAMQINAAALDISSPRVFSTDPPYYDNIGYADLSDFFYVWLRRSLKQSFPYLFSTLNVPKAEELVATPGRHGGRESAETFFLDGMTLAMQRIAKHSHPGFPTTIYYAFKGTSKNPNTYCTWPNRE
jgi:putative DNA methylase